MLFTNVKAIQGFYTIFQAISKVQEAKINSKLFKEPYIGMLFKGYKNTKMHPHFDRRFSLLVSCFADCGE